MTRPAALFPDGRLRRVTGGGPRDRFRIPESSLSRGSGILAGRVRSRLALFGLLAAAAAIFVPALRGYWLADDFDWVSDFHRLPWSDVPRLFLGEWARASSQEYRPLWALSFAADLRVWGMNPFALHATSLALHLIVCWLVWRLAAETPDASPLAGPLAAAFFAVMPLHAEPVSWISARGHLLAPIFILSTLLLWRRFERSGRRLLQVAAIGSALLAFATQEVAATLPPLLLFRDLVDGPIRDRRWVRRTLARHAPFWAILAGYLIFRYSRFGMLGRPGTFESATTLLREEFRALRTLWLSPVMAGAAVRGIAGRLARAALCLLAAALLLVPWATSRPRERAATSRHLIFFAGVWSLVCTAVLFGASSGRHFYLATVGPAVAWGLAGSRLFAGDRALARAGVIAIALLLVNAGLGLISDVSEYARSGRLSRVLAGEVDRALDEAGRDSRAVTVIVAEYPERRVVFWDYFYPVALEPPFRRTPPPPMVLPSFATCHCTPQAWKAEHAATLARLGEGDVSSIFLVIWDPSRSTFATRALTRAAFLRDGYLARHGPILRAGGAGSPEPELSWAAGP